MVHAAGTIFTGTVTGIELHPATGSQPVETVSVTFQVDDAIRGATPGGRLTISLWMGLWAGGQRYRTGEHVALFLYPASKLGLTSSVFGPMGRFEVDAAHRILISEQQRLAFRNDAVLTGKSRMSFRDLELAVRNARADDKTADRSAHAE